MDCLLCGHKLSDHDERGEPTVCQVPGCPCCEVNHLSKEHPFYKHYVKRAEEFKKKYGVQEKSKEQQLEEEIERLNGVLNVLIKTAEEAGDDYIAKMIRELRSV